MRTAFQLGLSITSVIVFLNSYFAFPRAEKLAAWLVLGAWMEVLLTFSLVVPCSELREFNPCIMYSLIPLLEFRCA